ncbi:MAG: hypothetical protein GC204_12715 [Chloroflexi bacterium]|nr:hypothetical protein [Chloroflexota bacterium]
MEHQISWIIPQRVILIQLSGVVEEAGFREHDLKVLQMLEAGDPNAALIHEILLLDKLENSASIRMMMSLSYPKHPRTGWMIAVGVKNPITKMVGNIATQILKVRTREMPTVEEALAFLFDIDSTLPKDVPIKTLVAQQQSAQTS